jgi:two-component system, chemotaxis family, sensor kinase CheA
MADPYKYFRIESRELLDELARLTLELESSGSMESLGSLLRAAHTLKGAARVVRRPGIADHAHAIEEGLADARAGGIAPSREVIDAVLKHLDAIGAELAALPPAAPLAQPRASAEGAPRPAPAQNEAAQNATLTALRAEIAEVDKLIEGIVETSVRLTELRSSLDAGAGLRGLIDKLAARTALPGDSETASEEIKALAQQLRDAFDQLRRNLSAGTDQIEQELRQTLEAAENLRLVPAGSLFVHIERAARDAAHALNKHVHFESRGGDVRLESHVLGTVQNALLHIVRNAVAHGIETPEARRAANKPETGRIRIEVARRGKLIEFACSDDGRGIDFAAVEQAARRRGDAPGGDLMATLLRGGLSTAKDVTTVAGRGIGMDVVRDAAEKLGGAVEARTYPGSGTTFVISVPLARALISTLMVEAAGLAATIPLDAVRATLRFSPQEVLQTAEGERLDYEGRSIPLFSLGPLLGHAPAPTAAARSAVVIGSADETAALCIDELFGIHSVVVRALPAWAPAFPFVAGASLDVAGNPHLMLDPRELLARARDAKMSPAATPATPPTILVIDDSLTTRMLERSILESAGYRVDTASSGEEGMEKARAQRYGLFLVDVEMPGMDGFSFIERTRADPALRDIPCVLVTSRAAPEDLQRGRDAGAVAHIDKGQFDQGNLLRHIGALLR